MFNILSHISFHLFDYPINKILISMLMYVNRNSARIIFFRVSTIHMYIYVPLIMEVFQRKIYQVLIWLIGTDENSSCSQNI